MSFFFMASGHFFSQKNVDNPKTFILRRIKSLYLPFVIFLSIYVLVVPPTTETMLQAFKRILLFIENSSDRGSELGYWFFGCLFFTSLISLLYFSIAKLFKKDENILKFMLFTITYIVAQILLKNDIHFYDPIFRSLFVAILFYFGWLWRQNENRIKITRIGTIICFLILLLSTIYGFRSDVNCYIFDTPVTFLLFSLVGFYMVIGFSKFINKNSTAEKWFGYIGRNTIVILLFNGISRRIYDVVFSNRIVVVGGVDWVLCSIFCLIVPLAINLVYEQIKTIFAKKLKILD